MDPKRSQNSFPEKFHMMAYRIRLKNANKFLTILMPVHLFFPFQPTAASVLRGNPVLSAAKQPLPTRGHGNYRSNTTDITFVELL